MAFGDDVALDAVLDANDADELVGLDVCDDVEEGVVIDELFVEPVSMVTLPTVPYIIGSAT